MKRPQDHRALPDGDFRAERSYLADHVFATGAGGGKRPDDVVDEEAWEHIMHLPTDVLLRTTDYLGTMVTDLHAQGSAWIFATPDEPAAAPFMFDAGSLDASDEFQAAPFIAIHGWYRQATAGLRNALESMTCAAAFAIRHDEAGLAAWRAGDLEPKFGNAVDSLQADPALHEADGRIGGAGLFGKRPAVLREAYAGLCRYSHGHPGHTNADIWQSNGPVLVGRAFTRFWFDFCDTIALSYVLLKIGWDALELPDVARPLFEFADSRWGGLGSKIEAEFFPGQ